MHDCQSLAYVRWECKYHVVIIPKYRRTVLYGVLRGKGVGSPSWEGRFGPGRRTYPCMIARAWPT